MHPGSGCLGLDSFARAIRAKLAPTTWFAHVRRQLCIVYVWIFVCVCGGGEGIFIIRRINKLGYKFVCVYVSGLGRGGEEGRIKTARTRFTNASVLKRTTRTEQKIKPSLIKNNLIISKISSSKIKKLNTLHSKIEVVFCKFFFYDKDQYPGCLYCGGGSANRILKFWV